MFEQPPQKPPHFAFHRIAIVGVIGGLLSMMVTVWLFGHERMSTSDAWLIGSFLPGAVVGSLLGYRWVIPEKVDWDD